jgi:preprotein translocase subunit SecG
MQIWMTLVLAAQLLAALAMIGLVLIQHGKGADMGASFGSGASGSLFGATGSANFLSRATAVLRHGVLRVHAGAGLHGQPATSMRGANAEAACWSAPPPAASARTTAPSRALPCLRLSRRRPLHRSPPRRRQLRRHCAGAAAVEVSAPAPAPARAGQGFRARI